jgi:hypothetical protein
MIAVICKTSIIDYHNEMSILEVIVINCKVSIVDSRNEMSVKVIIVTYKVIIVDCYKDCKVSDC